MNIILNFFDRQVGFPSLSLLSIVSGVTIVAGGAALVAGGAMAATSTITTGLSLLIGEMRSHINTA